MLIKTIEVHKTIQINGYSAHCKNILLGILADKVQKCRKNPVKIILEIRQSKRLCDDKLRKFLIPKINFDATGYTQMIKWTKNIT